VIGAGIVGAATAFFASRAGISCVVVEARAAPGMLTTAVAAGGYRLQLEHRDELGLVQRSLDLYRRFADETGQATHGSRLVEQGYLWLTTDPTCAERQRELVGRQREWGVTGIDLLGPAELRDRFPWVDDCVLAARFRAADGLIDPRSITMGLLAASGSPVVTGCRVHGLVVSGGRLRAVDTSAGPISCQAAVIACGPLSGTVARLAGVGLPVQAVRRQRVVLWDVPEVPADAPMTIDEDTGTHWRPTSAGAYLLHPDAGEQPAEPADVVEVDPRFADRLLDPDSPQAAARTAPFWRHVWERNVYSWAVQAGQYTMTPDQRPLIGATEVGGLWVNTGYSGHGVMAGPGGAALLAELIAGSRGAGDNPFAPGRRFEQSDQAW
jgi:sarcosine oxidase, subunit beta